jgi:hypothetical protein
MQVVYLIPGPLPSINLLFPLLQALEPRHCLLCNDGQPFGGVRNAFTQPLGHVVVGPDPGLLEGRTETLNVALRLCRVAAECAGSQGHRAPLVSAAWIDAPPAMLAGAPPSMTNMSHNSSAKSVLL